ncbi:MAG: hypothetical protein K2K01_07810, partial [Eubacterium sp.]|nr:hypothetical protein [Eubacterium sp.]
LKDFSYEEISNCEFLTYRVKTLAYLIKSKKFDDFTNFINHKEKFNHTTYEDKVVYEYDNVDVPLEFRTQNRFFIPSFYAKMNENNGSYIFSVNSNLWKNCEVEIAAVYLMNKGKREKTRLEVYNISKNNENIYFEYKLNKNKIESLKEGSDYYFTVCYVVHSRVSRTKITDNNDNVLAISRIGDSVKLVNGNYIFEKQQ